MFTDNRVERRSGKNKAVDSAVLDHMDRPFDFKHAYGWKIEKPLMRQIDDNLILLQIIHLQR